MTTESGAAYAGTLRRVVGRHPLVTRLQVFEDIGSTNDEGLRLARAGAASGTLLVADRQTAGRGRHGRRWESPQGVGLWFSLILRPELMLNRAFGVTAAAAVALVRLVADLTGVAAGIRWPNDVLVGSGKVAGLLSELGGRGERVDHLVLGVGLNVGQTPGDFPPDLRESATSLSLLVGHNVDRAVALDRFLEFFAPGYVSLVADDGAGVRSEWLRHAPIVDRLVNVDLGEGAGFQGRAAGLAADGALIVDTEFGPREIRAADVRLLRPLSGETR